MPSLFALFGLLGALYAVGGKRDKDSDDTEQRTDIMSDVSDEAETTPEVPVVAVENDVAEESQDGETIDDDLGEEPVVVVPVSEDHTAEIPEEFEAHEDVETVDHDEHNEHDHDEHEHHDGVDHVEGGEHDADTVHDEGVDHDEHEHHEGGDHADGGEHDDDAVHDEDADHDMSHEEHALTPEGFIDITEFGEYHHTSMHTGEAELEGGRTAITTEAHVAYNALRDFLDLDPVELETVGEWAFENDLTNNDEAFGDDLEAVGLFYSMQGTKVGWIDDESFDPQILADIQRTARLGEPEDVMDMVAIYGHDGFADYLEEEGLTEAFINTLKMEPHYGGIMHGRTHGDLEFEAEPGAEYETPTAHDLNHLTVLSHDQTQPFMNDTFDYPQWPALDASEEDVLNYFQSMVTLGDPHGEGISLEEIETVTDTMSEGELLMALLATDTVLDETLPSTEEMDEVHMEM